MNERTEEGRNERTDERKEGRKEGLYFVTVNLSEFEDDFKREFTNTGI